MLHWMVGKWSNSGEDFIELALLQKANANVHAVPKITVHLCSDKAKMCSKLCSIKFSSFIIKTVQKHIIHKNILSLKPNRELCMIDLFGTCSKN